MQYAMLNRLLLCTFLAVSSHLTASPTLEEHTFKKPLNQTEVFSPSTPSNCSFDQMVIPGFVLQQADKVGEAFEKLDASSLSKQQQKMIGAYWKIIEDGQGVVIKALTSDINLDDVSDQSLFPYLLQKQRTDLYSTFVKNGMPENKIDESVIEFWRKQLQKPLVSPKGQIYGCAPFAQLDTGWLQTGVNYLSQALGILEKVPFNGDHGQAYFAQPEVKIALIGDWGTGTTDAARLMESALKLKPDIVIHMGDVYYSGTYEEFQTRYLKLLPDQGAIPAQGTVPDFFMLNANHEMDGAGRGYFQTLQDSRFHLQRNSSFFSISLNSWTILGLDSAYDAEIPQYTKGRIAQKSQLDLIASFRDQHSRLIVLTHHNPIKHDGSGSEPLWNDIADTIGKKHMPAYWYFGHIHIGAAYSDLSFAGQNNVKARCTGFAGIPTGRGSSFFNTNGHLLESIDFYAHEPAPKKPPHINNGFLMLTIEGEQLSEAYYDLNGKRLWLSRNND